MALQEAVESARGRPAARVDAGLKVRGAAPFVADLPLPPGCLHAALVGSEIAAGRVRGANLDRVRAMPGVRHVLMHGAVPKLAPPPKAGQPTWFGEVSAPLQDDRVDYLGQPVAVVVADTAAQADMAARTLRLTYDAAKPFLGIDGEARLPETFAEGNKLQVERGDLAAAMRTAPVALSSEFETPSNHHAPMEVPAAVAVWTGDRLQLWITSRGVVDMRDIVANAFGLPPVNVVVTCPYVGGAFGAKGWLFDHAMLTAAAARVAGRPVRLVLTREQMMTSQGRRPMTRQTVALGAARDGRLAALRHDTATHTARNSPFFTEQAGTKSTHLYACPALSVAHRLVSADVAPPVPMRGPGGAPGSFALETAMDELAVKLGIDPVELRLRNLPQGGDPASGKPWTSFNAEECWRRAAATFGWARRDARPRATRDGDEFIGWGCATAAYPADRRDAMATVALLRDGSIEVRVATHDAGHGTYTALTLVASDALGLPPERIRVLLGDTRYPRAPTSGGSTTLASAGSAVVAACTALKADVAALGDAGGGDWTAPLRRSGRDRIEATAAGGAGDAKDKFGTYSFGAQFVEARVHARLGTVRVTRFVGVYDVGRVLDPVRARGQIHGGVLFGIGQALMEHGIYDTTGRLGTPDLGSYHVPVCADVPAEFVVDFVDRPDTRFTPMGTRGVGEIGVFGVAGAVANAVHHATGKRVRKLPMTVEELL